MYSSNYNSPVGTLLILCDDNSLCGLYKLDQKHYLNNINDEIIPDDNNTIILKVKNWLDDYFSKKKPSITNIPLNPFGNKFRKIIWSILIEIPYGKTTTYGDIAKEVALILNKKKMSAQAVGNAISNNPISIIIPCHRVIGKNGSLTGYAGGIEMKRYLLELEKDA